MANKPSLNTSGLANIGLRYPEKTYYLGQVFSNTTNSYKLFWFLGLLSLIKKTSETSFFLDDVLCEMVTIAWHPVCFYRLSLGRQDKLQEVITEIRAISGLPPNAEAHEIQKFLNSSTDIQAQLNLIARYVPTRFLTPWFARQLRGVPDSRRTSLIETLAKQSRHMLSASLYYIDNETTTKRICLNESWKSFLIENIGVVQGFAEYCLSLYLQRRNPNIPGIINKLQSPTERYLRGARRFWYEVKKQLENNSKGDIFKDIYSKKTLTDSFSVDHFLPWSFVAHDLLWNLTPVEKSTNSSKGDSLPDVDIYLPRLAKLHRESIIAVQHKPRLIEDFTDFFKQDVAGVISLSESAFIIKYKEGMRPQVQIAKNQGFVTGWVL